MTSWPFMGQFLRCISVVSDGHRLTFAMSAPPDRQLAIAEEAARKMWRTYFVHVVSPSGVETS
jgi:hypothetical protein